MPQNVGMLVLAAGLMFGILAGITTLSNFYSLNIKAKTMGNGQHGTAPQKRHAERFFAYVLIDPGATRYVLHRIEKGVWLISRIPFSIYNSHRIINNSDKIPDF